MRIRGCSTICEHSVNINMQNNKMENSRQKEKVHNMGIDPIEYFKQRVRQRAYRISNQ